MKHASKRILAWLLCAVMLLALLPSFAAAEEDASPLDPPALADGEPTEELPDDGDPALDEPALDEPAEELPETDEPAPDEPSEELPETEPAAVEPEGDLPEIEQTEPEQEQENAELQETEANSGLITVLDEPIDNSTVNEIEITQPGETVYRPFVPEKDGFYRFTVYPDSTLGKLVDGDFRELEYLLTEQPMNCYFVTYYAEAGKSYYFGTYFQSQERIGKTSVSVRWFSPNSCGDSMTWSFDEETGVLRLGSGRMWEFTPETVPWSAYREQIKTLHLPSNSTVYIGQYAFYGCTNLETIENSAEISGIQAYAFYGTALREMVWPGPCTFGGIGAYAFAYCKDLKTCIIGKNNWSYGIGDHAFYASGLETASFGYNLHEVHSYAFAECKDLTAVSLPNDFTMYNLCMSFGDYVFRNSGLPSLQIPKSLEVIGAGIFAGCKNLTSLAIDSENTVYTVKDGLLLTKDGKTLVAATYRTASGAYTTPVGIQSVADSAFCGCSGLTAITVSPGIAKIGKEAFEECTALSEVTISQTLTEIQSSAFSDCPALTDVQYQGYEEDRARLTIDETGNDALLNATWHYLEKSSFDGAVVWNDEDVQFKGTTPYMTWTGSALEPRFVLNDAEGNPVDPQTYTYEYRENVDAGTGYVFVTFTEGYTGALRLFFKIYLPATTQTSVENVADGIRISWAPVEGATGYVIYRRAWNLQSAGWTTFERWNNTTGTSWTDKTVYAGTRYQYGVKAYFAQRMDAVTGAMIGGNVGDNFNLGHVGPLKTTVRITTRHLVSLKPASGKITATWEASKVFTGYQLKYATNEAFTKDVKTVKIADPSTVSTVLKSLKNGTTYYVAVRSYHEFAGMTYFGQWSNVIRVKAGAVYTVYDVMYRALTIGENNYKTSPLKGCVNDATTMTGMLQGLNRPFTVNKLQNVKKAEIINAIRTTFADAWDTDISVFTYSGHGVQASDSSNPYHGALVPIDEDYITLKELAQELSKVRGRIVVILDSCHSGAAIALDRRASETDAFNQAVIEAFSGYYLEDDAQEGEPGTRMGEMRTSKFIVITAAGYWQSSYDGKFDGSGYDQGAFTAALIKGMGCRYTSGKYLGSMPADKNNDKKVTLKELYDYIINQVSSWRLSQSAQYYGPDDFVLFKR